jgi:hypothetical protein
MALIAVAVGLREGTRKVMNYLTKFSVFSLERIFG